MRRPGRVWDHSRDGRREDHAPHRWVGLQSGLEDIDGALHGRRDQFRLWVFWVLEGARRSDVEDTGAAVDGGGDSICVEEVGVEDLKAGIGSTWEREEVGSIGAWEDGGVDGWVGIAVFEEGLHQP